MNNGAVKDQLFYLQKKIETGLTACYSTQHELMHKLAALLSGDAAVVNYVISVIGVDEFNVRLSTIVERTTGIKMQEGII
jgi:hypothetical protein